MSTPGSVAGGVELTVENVGGIDRRSVAFSPGVTILAGRNATNRTSLLQGLMAGLGSQSVSIKGDADEATVELTVDDETYSLTLERDGGSVAIEGDPHPADGDLVDSFAYLVESNDARRAVEPDRDLREIIMGPIDTAAVEARIADLEAESDEIDRRLQTLRSLRRRLPELEQRREDLEARIEEQRAELESVEAAIEEAEGEMSSAHSSRTDLEGALESLRDTRDALEDVRYRIDSERESIEALESEVDEHERELASLPDAPMAAVSDVEERIEALRADRDDLDADINDIQKIIRFNEEMLDGTDSEIVAALRDAGGDTVGSATGDQVTCWTCGSEVESESVRTTIDRLREFRAGRLQQLKNLQSEMRDLKTEKATYEEQQRQRAQLEDYRQQASSELADRRERLEELETERDRLETEVGDLEAEIDDLRERRDDELLDSHREANRIEVEIRELQQDLGDVTDELAELESRLDEWESLRARRERITEKIDEERSRIETVERRAIEEFNRHMETVLRVLDYGNLERVWIERRQSADASEDSTLTLHVVRGTSDGASYEDSVAHLSESEREVTGLVFALAGYLAHDVHEVCPFLVLDSIEAIDSDRIARLIEYLSEYAEYVVVALLEADARALSEEYERIGMS